MQFNSVWWIATCISTATPSIPLWIYVSIVQHPTYWTSLFIIEESRNKEKKYSTRNGLAEQWKYTIQYNVLICWFSKSWWGYSHLMELTKHLGLPLHFHSLIYISVLLSPVWHSIKHGACIFIIHTEQYSINVTSLNESQTMCSIIYVLKINHIYQSVYSWQSSVHIGLSCKTGYVYNVHKGAPLATIVAFVFFTLQINSDLEAACIHSRQVVWLHKTTHSRQGGQHTDNTVQ